MLSERAPLTTGLGTGRIMKTVEHLLEETRLSVEEVSARCGLTAERVAAIAEGRWTPGPQEREQIAAALGVTAAEISWGHSINPRNIRYRRFGLRRISKRLTL